MTIVEILSRVANRYSKGRYAGLTAQGQQEALDAINGAMMELYRLLPDHYKNKTVNISVEAPTAASIAFVNGDNGVATDTFSFSQIGRTLVGAGDDIQHRIGARDALQDVWLGQTGTVATTIYHDYVYGADYPFNRLLTHPVVISGSVEIPLVLINQQDVDLQSMRGVGRPRYYWLEQGGVSQGGDLVAAIRLLPMPDIAYRLRVRASYWPRRVLFPDVGINASLPVPDMVAEAFIKLVGTHLLGLAGWDAMPADAIMAQATSAGVQIASISQVAGLPANRVGTPRGW